MKHLFAAILLTSVLATPVAAANVYLKDGGMIKAKSVWRSKGMIMVLVNRDTLAEFHPSEINMRRTFAKRRHPVRPRPDAPAAVQPQAGAQGSPDTPTGARKGMTLPKLPSLTTALPEKSPSSTGNRDEGSIRKHKREMSEKAGEAAR